MEKVITVNSLDDCCLLHEPAEKIIVESSRGIDENFNFHSLRNLGKIKEIQVLGSENAYSSGDMIFCRTERGLMLAFSLGREKTAVIPDGVNIIGSRAFYGTDIKSVRLPESVIEISSEAFMNCKFLTKVKLPNKLSKLGDAVFQGCLSLKSVSIPGSVREIPISAFCYCPSLLHVKLQEGLQVIQNSAFSECSSLKTINIPESVREIGRNAFVQCCSLTDVELPAKLQKIKTHTFSNCSSLKSIRLPECLQTIGEYAFRGCVSLTSIDIPDSVQEIGNRVFFDCSSLVHVKLPPDIQKIEDGTFRGCSNLKSINFTEGLTQIGALAFYGCKSLKSIDIPGSVWNIGNRAFLECESLSQITLHEGLACIEQYAFLGCKLKEISLPASVYGLQSGSLYGMELVHVKGYIPKLINAVASQEKSFCVDCGTEKIVFPGSMTPSSVMKANGVYHSVVNHQGVVPKVHALYALGNTARSKHLAALKAYRLSKDEELGKYLKRNGSKLLGYINSEEEMLALLNDFRDIGLTDSMVKKGLALSEDRGWTIATAYILKQPKKISKSSFSL